MNAFFEALFFSAGYNTALVSTGAILLGASGGAIGTFILLRKRALITDAVSHATLPGLALAFIGMAKLWNDGRWLPGLMAGAALSAALGLAAVLFITRRTRLPEDTAIGAVLSVFFGAGVVLVTVIQSMTTGGQAGITSFLVGGAASMLRNEAVTIAVAALLTGLTVLVLRRPFTLVCFDAEFAAVQGLRVWLVDAAMMALALAVTVIGLKVAGLVLVVALTIIPPAAARLWTNHPGRMAMIAALIGALSAHLGVVFSTLRDNVPTGAVIVLVAFALFTLSLILSPVRGLVREIALRQRLGRDARQAMLRAMLSRPAWRCDVHAMEALMRSGYVDADGRLRRLAP